MADNVPITAGSGTNVATDVIGSVHYQRVKISVGADGSATDAKTVDADTGAGSDPTLGVALVYPASGGGVNATGDSTNGLDVDVTRVIPGTTASALGKAEDAPHADGDTGVLILGVRNHSGTGSDGDYSAMSVTTTGELRVMTHRPLVRSSVASGGLTTSVTAYTAGDQVGTEFTMTGCARTTGGSGYITGVTLVDATDIIGAYDVVIFDSATTPAADNAAASWSDTDALKIVAVIPLVGAYDTGLNRVAQAQNLMIPFVCSGGTSLFADLICRVGHTFFGATTALQLILYVEQN